MTEVWLVVSFWVAAQKNEVCRFRNTYKEVRIVRMEPDFRDVIAERVPVASERCRLSDVPEEEERVVHHLEKQGQCWS